MKVLFVDQFGKTTGRDSLALANLIEKDDIHMTVFLSDSTEIPTDKEYRVQIMKGFHGAYEGNAINKVIHYLKSLKELKRFIHENDFEIIHLQWFSLPWIEWIYVRNLRKKARIVITVHDVVPFDKRPFEMQSLKKIYNSADRILVHTDKAKNEFEKIYKVKTPISVITQGFCYKPDYMKFDKNEARRYLGIPSDSIVFLYYGTIRQSKGLDVLMEALGEAKKKMPNIFLLAAGAFHNVEESRYNRLAEQLRNCGSRIDFGFLPYEKEKYYFSASDVLVLPYTQGTQSGVAQLGLMYELPIIASDISCLDEVAENNTNALRFEVNNVSDLVRCILELADDGEKRIRFSEKSKAIGESVFSLEKKASFVEQAYHDSVRLNDGVCV